MKFVFFNQCELCADTIIDILKSENIPYRIKSSKVGIFDSTTLYNITIDTTFEHWLFVQKIAVDKLTPYMRAEKSWALPSYDNKPKRVALEGSTPIFLIDKLQRENAYDFELVVKKPRKSLLKRLIDFVSKNF